jgi:glycosyltransferase involved in cell wall biosynthesis
LVKADITHVLPGSGVDIQHFSPRNLSEERADNSFRFLLVARLLYDKGIIEYVQAIRLLKARGIKANFRLLGKIDPDKGLGVSQEQVASWVAEGLLEYCGEVDNVIPFIEQADCVLLPSYREGTPRTLLEAASLGKPIITTDVPGCRETVIHGHNGYLCKVKNPESLAESMQTMASLAPDILRQMSQNSRELAVNKFDQRIVISKYQAAIAQLTGEKSARNKQFATV